MGKYIFLFDLDSTVLKEEILQAVSRQSGLSEQMDRLAGGMAKERIPFKQGFLQRVDLLKNIPVSEVCRIVDEIPLNDKVLEFIQNNRERSYVVTENLDVWTEGLMKKIGIESHTFSSKALVKDDYLQDVISIVDKSAVVSQMVLPFVAVGNGDNDAEMIEAAEVGIGYGAGKEPAASVLSCASHAVYQEEKLTEFLYRLV